jgi:hypothetical protein
MFLIVPTKMVALALALLMLVASGAASVFLSQQSGYLHQCN